MAAISRGQRASAQNRRAPRFPAVRWGQRPDAIRQLDAEVSAATNGRVRAQFYAPQLSAHARMVRGAIEVDGTAPLPRRFIPRRVAG